MQSVEVVAEPVARGALVLVGQLHPLTVHFPIAWLLLALLLELGGLVLRRPGWQRASVPLLGLALASFLPSITSGLLRASAGAHDDPNELAAVLDHRNLMLAATACGTLALALGLWQRRHQDRRAPRWAYRALLIAAALLVLTGAHLGASLVYGAHNLPF